MTLFQTFDDNKMKMHLAIAFILCITAAAMAKGKGSGGDWSSFGSGWSSDEGWTSFKLKQLAFHNLYIFQMRTSVVGQTAMIACYLKHIRISPLITLQRSRSS